MRCEAHMKQSRLSHLSQMGLCIRRSFAIVTTVTLVVLVLFLSYSGDFQSDPSKQQPTALKWTLEDRGFVLDTPGCRIPDWDPYDPSVLPFVSRGEQLPYKCPGRPQFMRAAPNAVITLDRNLLGLYYGVRPGNVSCSYRPIVRDPGPESERTDNKYTLGGYRDLQFGTPLQSDFIVVNCSLGELPTFTQYLPLVPLKPKVEEVKSRRDSVTNEDQLNVILVGIDSVSKLNFLRHFRKTHKYLRHRLSPHLFELRGYAKVADNTFPNLVPLLTGRFVERYWNESMRDMFFDAVDFVWKDYSARGYRTLFAEDAPRIATFNYLKRGFRDPPADYYFRPFALAVEKSLAGEGRPNCLHSVLEIEVLFKYLRDFVRTMGENRRLFAFTFVARLTHDSLNAAAHADEPTVHLLKDLYSEGALNQSVLVLFSDHGIRFGPIRQTYIGKFEERMPFMFLLFPPWFLAKHPDFEQSLRLNQDRLTTPFDIHATLVHLLNVSNEDATDGEASFGRSLLRPVSENRTCEQAGILPHWCPCQVHKPVPTTEPAVANSATALVDTLNRLLEPHSAVCAELRLDRILDARSGQAGDAVLRFVRHQGDVIDRHVILGERVSAPEDYLLVVRTTPSGAVFEGTVRYDSGDGTYRVLDDISRLNAYGNQSRCIDSARLRKFCYCRSQQSSLFHKIFRTARDNSSNT